jgi:thiosulfate/3-mercaptopyruvate sulfurtransferase
MTVPVGAVPGNDGAGRHGAKGDGGGLTTPVARLPILVETADLAGRLDDPSLRIFDATAFLRREVDGGPYTVESGRASYRTGHIPGAAFADVPGELSDPGSPWRFTVPSAGQFASAIGHLGVGPGVHVVAYAQESPMWATRLWWLLRVFGFDDASVLNGGLTAWRLEGRPLEQGDRAYEPATFVAHPRPELLAAKEEVAAAGGAACLVNGLTPAAFRGDGPGAYSRPGRIPGSVSVPAGSLLDPVTTRFADADTLAAHFAAAGAGPDGPPVIAYCGGGISATVDLFALRLLGRDGRLYDGSLTEWSADPDLPLEVD